MSLQSTKPSRTIQVPPVEFALYLVTLVGTCPLLVREWAVQSSPMAGEDVFGFPLTGLLHMVRSCWRADWFRPQLQTGLSFRNPSPTCQASVLVPLKGTPHPETVPNGKVYSCFPKWSMTFLVRAVTHLVSDSAEIKQLFTYAGEHIGLGQLREAPGQPYGLFKLGSFQPKGKVIARAGHSAPVSSAKRGAELVKELLSI